MKSGRVKQHLSKKRRSGVLLHPTSLPESPGNGDIGHQAYRFIEFLSSSGFKVWQMLPLGPTHEDKSPYQCLSSHAGNPLLISLDWLEDKGWLNRKNINKNKVSDDEFRRLCLKQACENFYQVNDQYWSTEISQFIKKHSYWLDDYALYMAFKCIYQDKPWYEWPEDTRHRDKNSLDSARKKLKSNLQQTKFEQFVFFRQWYEIREYAKKYGIELFGDMPIFVAHDSADVWAQRENFLMDADGKMPFIAGVPPDAFSETGQRWGNPLYDWEYMQASGFKWWKNRLKTQLEFFDLIRIDHFRGLQACWQIPEDEETAMNGFWVEVPGKELLEELFNTYDDLPLVAEDLGVITEEVIELKNLFHLPGMKVLQFAFDGNNANPHLPHHHESNDVIYTGTHDNDTTLGWIKSKSNYNRSYFEAYVDSEFDEPEQGVLSMIRMAMSSVSFLCVVPLQDILMLDSKARMNTPGTLGNNWNWRCEWTQIRPEIIEVLQKYIKVYQR